MAPFLIALLFLANAGLSAQTPDQVLVVVNKKSASSRQIGEYYIQKRGIPLTNLCAISTEPVEEITRDVYDSEIEAPVGKFLTSKGLREKILYIVLTTGVPLRIRGPGEALRSETAAVDSELTLVYQRLRGISIPAAGPAPNPFFRQRDTPFRHPLFPIYLVTRLDGYDMADMKALVDRAQAARNTGNWVIDLRSDNDTEGNAWLRTAALLLPQKRVVMDETARVISETKGVIGYASWGSNDRDRKHRLLHFEWLPGAIATEFVSTDGRTFRPPPKDWEIGTWANKSSYYSDSPQTLTADYIHEGATGASGQVDEPYLSYCPRPDFVLPAYSSGRTLAESFYIGIPALSWMTVVIGDPLARLIP
jgi:uncharacterized protein (TIGR03790 family)